MIKLLPLLIFFAVGSSSQPDSITIADVTVTANARNPLIAVAIDTTIMERSSSFSLGDLLLRSSSVNIKSYGRGAEQTATFRGTSATHTAVYWNGLQINSPLTGAVDFSLIPTEMVDKVSVEAGVSADAHGSGALGGSVILKNEPGDFTKPFGVTISAGYGSFSTTDGYLEFRAGNSKIKSNTRIYGTRSKNDFWFENRDIFDPEKPGWHPEQKNLHADYSSFGCMEQLWAQLKENQTLSTTIWGTGNLRNLPQLTAWEGEENSNLTDTRDRALRAVIDYKYYGRKIDFGISLGGSLEDNMFEKNNKVAQGYQKYIDTKGFSRLGQIEGNLLWKINDRFAIRSLTRGIYTSASSRDFLYGEGYDENRGEVSETATFEAKWNSWLNSSIMGRAGMVGGDMYVLPTAAVNFALSDASSISLRADMDVHFPTLSDLYYIPGGNKDLRSEKSTTAEIGYAYHKNDLRIMGTAYYSYIKDWILWLPTSQQFWTPKNILEVDSYGIEATADKVWKWGDWRLQLSGNFTVNITRSRSEYGGEQMPYVPPISYSAFIQAGWKNLALTLQGYGESAKYASLATSSAKTEVISDYYLQDLTLSYKYKFFHIEGSCRNLFDSKYYGVLRRPMAPRSFEIRLRFFL